MSIGANSGYSRLPSASKAVKLLGMRDADDAALEFYESWNSAWRTQYNNPVIACRCIGSELSPDKYKLKLKNSEAMVYEDAENLFSGNTTLSALDDPFHLINYLSGYIESEDENLTLNLD